MDSGNPDKERAAGGTDIMDVVMTVVQIVGFLATVVLLRRFTPLPPEACFVLGFPLFLLVFWGAILALGALGKRGKP